MSDHELRIQVAHNRVDEGDTRSMIEMQYLIEVECSSRVVEPAGKRNWKLYSLRSVTFILCNIDFRMFVVVVSCGRVSDWCNTSHPAASTSTSPAR
jgi:hypothetical protein